MYLESNHINLNLPCPLLCKNQTSLTKYHTVHVCTVPGIDSVIHFYFTRFYYVSGPIKSMLVSCVLYTLNYFYPSVKEAMGPWPARSGGRWRHYHFHFKTSAGKRFFRYTFNGGCIVLAQPFPTSYVCMLSYVPFCFRFWLSLASTICTYHTSITLRVPVPVAVTLLLFIVRDQELELCQ